MLKYYQYRQSYKPHSECAKVEIVFQKRSDHRRCAGIIVVIVIFSITSIIITIVIPIITMARIKTTITREEKMKRLLDEGIAELSDGGRKDGYPIIHLTPEDPEYGEVMKKILKRKQDEKQHEVTGTEAQPTTLQLWIDKVEKDIEVKSKDKEEKETPTEGSQSIVRNSGGGSDSEKQRLLLMREDERLTFLTRKYFLKRESEVMRRMRRLVQVLDCDLRRFKKGLSDAERSASERGFKLTAKLYKGFHVEYHRIGGVKIKMLKYMIKVIRKYETATNEKFQALQDLINDFSNNGEVIV